MDKLIVDSKSICFPDIDQVTISNDGATILKLMDIVHPAGKALVDISRAQDAEVGDGTTSVTLFAAELLKEIKQFIEEGVSPQIIIKGFRKASLLVSLWFIYRQLTKSKKLLLVSNVMMKLNSVPCWKNVLLLQCLLN
jgi:T-complex protein 1 subunit eta